MQVGLLLFAKHYSETAINSKARHNNTDIVALDRFLEVASSHRRIASVFGVVRADGRGGSEEE
jgi:hypothetical protein